MFVHRFLINRFFRRVVVRFTKTFEAKLKDILGKRFCMLLHYIHKTGHSCTVAISACSCLGITVLFLHYITVYSIIIYLQCS